MLVPAFLGFILLAPALALWFSLQRHQGHPASLQYKSGVCLFTYYLFGLWWMTGIGPLQPFSPRVVLVPFSDMIAGPVDTVLNILLFVPLGFFLPLLWRDYASMKKTVLTGLFLSLAVELLQMFGLGITDINDLITNTAGTLAGFCLFQLLSRSMQSARLRPWRKGSQRGMVAVPCLVLASLLVMLILQRPFLRLVLSLAGF